MGRRKGIVGTAELARQRQHVETLYTDHHGWLQGWLRRRLGDACNAADLAQDTFVRLIVRPRSLHFDSGSQARAYLSTIARGLVIDHWRRRELEQAWLSRAFQISPPMAL